MQKECSCQLRSCLTWLLCAAHLQENAAAFSVKLSQEDKAYLEDIFAPEKVGRIIVCDVATGLRSTPGTRPCILLPRHLTQACLHCGLQVSGGRYAEAAAKYSFDAHKRQAVS